MERPNEKIGINDIMEFNYGLERKRFEREWNKFQFILSMGIALKIEILSM